MHQSLSDILVDVAANAIEAASTIVYVTVIEDGTRISFTVKDNGKGMPPNILARAFDPFYTEPGKHDKRKIGMGLPFVKQTCDACGGEVSLESEVGKGTELKCSFDAASIDLPPMGDLVGAVLSLFNYPGKFDLVFTHKSPSVDYAISRAELSEAVGGFESVDSLSLARDFLLSQEGLLDV